MAQVTQPFNYLSMVQNPAQEALQAFQGAYQARQQQQQNEMFRSAFNEFARKPNKGVSDYVQLLQVTPPEMVAGVKASFDAMTKEQQDVAKRDLGQLIFAFKYDPERGKNLVDQRIEAARNAGDMQEVQSLQTLRKLADIDADSVVEALAMQGGMAFGDEFLKQIPGLAAPAEKKVQSTLRIPDTGTFVTVFTDGTSQAVDDAGNVLTGEARAEAIRSAQERGIQVQRERAGGRELAKISAQEGKLALQGARSAQGNIANLKEARRLVAEEGASTGVLQRFLPTFRDSTIALREVQRRLGLDVIGSVTFGALSEAELQLALDTALPTDLSGPALIEYLDRKIVAQEKVAREQQKLAEYLLRGGDLGTYLAESGAPSPAGGTTRTADDILAELRASGSLN
jgi:hypothetical protein